MSKLLINAPSGEQEIIVVGEGGGYFDLSRVLWDERVDGPMPAVTLGGMVRNGATLVVDQALLESSNAAILAEAKSAMWEKIKAERDRRKAAGVQVGAHWFHSDDPSRIQQIGLVMMGANLPANLQWKTMSGAFVTMTQALAGQIFQAVAAKDQAIFAKAEQHKAAMEAAANPLDYNHLTGWPAVYGE
jgi:hypothetical protein